jgi:WD40 repeat protein
LENRGIVVPSRGWVLAVDRDERLTAWRVNAKLAAELPAKPPKSNMWPDIAVVRDAPSGQIAGVAFTPDGDQVIVASQDGKLSRYSSERLQYVAEVETGESPARSMIRVGDRLFVLGGKGTVMTRDAKSLEKEVEFTAPTLSGGMPNLFAVHPESAYFLVVTDKLRVIDTKTKKETTIATTPKVAIGKPLTQFAYSADGKVGVARWGDAVMAVWHPKFTGTSKILEDLKSPLPASPNAIAMSNDGKVAILGTGDGRIRAWNTSTGEVLHTEDVYPPAGTGDAVTGIVMHPSGKHFLSAGRDGRVILWALDGFKKVKEFRGPDGPWRLAISPDGRGAVLVQSGMMMRIELPGLTKGNE